MKIAILRAKRRTGAPVKPRNPVMAAIKHGQAARGGAHGKSRGALRRAEKVAVARALVEGS